jgi:hypothetical protein
MMKSQRGRKMKTISKSGTYRTPWRTYNTNLKETEIRR